VRQYAAPLQLEKEDLRLDQLVEQAWDHLAVVRKNRDATLSLASSSIVPRCPGDRMALEQVFRNILENSLAACSDPVRITVHWSNISMEGRSGIRIGIRDNGPGFTHEQHTRIFEPFFTTKTKGTGLGLAITKRMIEAHCGSIEAQNYEGGGEILITLPREGNSE
jgi:signal transduction histidine kinase